MNNKAMDCAALTLTIIDAVNWGLIGFFNFNLVAFLFGSMSWLSRIIYAESGGESITGQIAVGNVILNRVKSSQFPDTVEGVIFDRKDAVQFEPVGNGRVYQTPSAQSVEAAKRALDGENVIGSALYFYAPALSQGVWINASCTYQQTIGCHRFYL